MSNNTLETISDEINKCTKCDLYKTRNNAVSGAGCKTADILFIGEAPGKNEDIQGKPFVGRAGKILDKLLENIDLDRNQIFIGNTLKCRPVSLDFIKDDICITCEKFAECYKSYLTK